MRKASARADEIVLLAYGNARAQAWWSVQRGPLERIANLTVYNVDASSGEAWGALVERSMRLNVTIEDAQVRISSDAASVCVEPAVLKQAR